MTANRRAGRIETHDIEEQAEVSALRVRFEQLSPGPFHSTMEYIRIPGLMVYRQHINQTIHVRGKGSDAHVMIGAVATPDSRVEWNGVNIDARHLALALPSSELDFSIFADSRPVVLLARPDRLARYLGEESVADLSTARPVIDCDPKFSAWLIGASNRLIDKYLDQEELLKDDRECDAVESEVLGGLAWEFAAGDAELSAESKPKRTQALLRAIEYAESSEQPIPIPDLVRVAGVSQRTLEYAFRETLNISPAKYLRWHRINRLHGVLLASEPRSTSITATASRFGFTEMGRLAVEYRQLFGESPSATLARSITSQDIRLKTLLDSN
jgi:AraC family ethanolamine operon transcriptional activator